MKHDRNEPPGARENDQTNPGMTMRPSDVSKLDLSQVHDASSGAHALAALGHRRDASAFETASPQPAGIC